MSISRLKLQELVREHEKTIARIGAIVPYNSWTALKDA